MSKFKYLLLGVAASIVLLVLGTTYSGVVDVNDLVVHGKITFSNGTTLSMGSYQTKVLAQADSVRLKVVQDSITSLRSSIDLKYAKRVTHRVTTRTDTLKVTDAGREVWSNVATVSNICIPANVFAVGDIITVVNYGAGQVTLVPLANVTYHAADGFTKLRVRYSTVTVQIDSTNVARAVGDGTN